MKLDNRAIAESALRNLGGSPSGIVTTALVTAIVDAVVQAINEAPCDNCSAPAGQGHWLTSCAPGGRL